MCSRGGRRLRVGLKLRPRDDTISRQILMCMCSCAHENLSRYGMYTVHMILSVC